MLNRPTLLVAVALLVAATFARSGQTQGQTDWNAPFPPHKVIELGGETLTAYRTPGHTKGNTSWWLEVQEDGRTYNALIVGSFGVNANYRLVNNPDYPNQAQDYMAMFTRVRSLPVDVFLGSHGRFYGLAEKYERLKTRKAGEPNPFVDHAGYLAHIDLQEGNFQKMLAEQTAAR